MKIEIDEERKMSGYTLMDFERWKKKWDPSNISFTGLKYFFEDNELSFGFAEDYALRMTGQKHSVRDILDGKYIPCTQFLLACSVVFQEPLSTFVDFNNYEIKHKQIAFAAPGFDYDESLRAARDDIDVWKYRIKPIICPSFMELDWSVGFDGVEPCLYNLKHVYYICKAMQCAPEVILGAKVTWYYGFEDDPYDTDVRILDYKYDYSLIDEELKERIVRFSFGEINPNLI